MSFVKPHRGKQTVVADSRGGIPAGWQVNTYNGESWLIDKYVKSEDIDATKKAQLLRMEGKA